MIAGEDARLLFDEITAEDLPQTWQELADAIGLANVMQLCRKTGGTSIYIPKWDSLTAPAKRRIVLRLFNGGEPKKVWGRG